MDPVRQLIVDRVAKLGTTLKAASLAMKRNHAYLQQFVERGVPVELKERDRVALADILGVDEALLRSEPAPPSRPAPNASHPIDVPQLPTRRVPVFGQAAGGQDEDGRFILNGNKVADALVLPGLEDIKNLYAVYIYGVSMLPTFRPGDTAFVDPSRPVVSEDDVVVQVKLDPHEPPFGFVKQFISKRRGELVLEQHNPPEGAEKTVTFPLKLVVAVHKVVGVGRR